MEMIEIYQNKGLSKEDATTIIDVMSKYKDVFVDAMLVDELGILSLSFSSDLYMLIILNV